MLVQGASGRLDLCILKLPSNPIFMTVHGVKWRAVGANRLGNEVIVGKHESGEKLRAKCFTFSCLSYPSPPPSPLAHSLRLARKGNGAVSLRSWAGACIGNKFSR